MVRSAALLSVLLWVMGSVSGWAQGVDTVWTRWYGPAGSKWAQGIARDPQGNVVVVGSEGGPLSSTCVVIKYKPSGDTVWMRKYYNSSHDVTDYPQGVAVDKLGNIYVAGWCFPGGIPNMNFLVIKFSPGGDTLWTRRYNEGDNAEAAWGVAVDTSGKNIYVTGNDASHCLTVKYSPTGDTLWTRVYTPFPCGYGVATDDSGNVYVVGAYPIKYSPQGNLLLEANGGLHANFNGVALDPRGNIYAAAFSGADVSKFSPQGANLWNRAASSLWGWNGIAVDSGGNVYAVGLDNTFLNYATGKYSAAGDSLWFVMYPAGYQCTEYGIALADSGNFYVTGWSGDQQFLTIKYHERPSGVEGKTDVRNRLPEAGLKATPNPFTSFATVPGHERETFDLYDISGRRVGTFRGDRIGEGLAPGVYFLRGEDKAGKPIRVVKVR